GLVLWCGAPRPARHVSETQRRGYGATGLLDWTMLHYEEQATMPSQTMPLPPRIVLAGRIFDLAGPIVLDRTADGYLEYQPHARYKGVGTEPLNPYGLGPFCCFKVADAPRAPGLYAFVADGVPVYVGRSANIASRLSAVNY